MKFSFFKTEKPKPFEYRPLYYDPIKEKREQRRKELGLDDGNSDHKSFFKGELQSKWRRGGDPREEKSKKKTIIYMVILLIAVYYIFFTDFVEKMVTVITRI